jgi:N-acetylglucosamine PTS system EIICBA or EIICB component
MLAKFLAALQQLGRALMLPIAVLPIAGLLLRLGQPDLLDVAWIAAAGDAIFSNLGLIFAIGVAVGLARENHGAAGLAGVVGFLVTTHGAQALISVPPDALASLTGHARELAISDYKTHEIAKLGVPIGIINGLIAGAIYNRYHDIRLPSYLSFFGGRRFIPIATGIIGMALAGAFGWSWPYLERSMDSLSGAILGSGYVGLFAYGVLNRALIVTGLHHILNNLAWFLLGNYHGVTGDLHRFVAGDPTAGQFMSGFFPVMMFGLPAACLAMYHTALPDRRKAVAGFLLSLALTSFLTGVTEPIEFTFMFLAPVLYGIHAVLTGVAMVVMKFAGVHLGFSFSAGFFDYVLYYGRATRPWLLLPIGAAYFVIYYALFRFFIVRLNLHTPGRDPTLAPVIETKVDSTDADQAKAFITALGGAANLLQVDACTTRLRLKVADQSRVSPEALRQLGASGTVQLSAQALQVVLGPIADQVAGQIRAQLRLPIPATALPAAMTQAALTYDAHYPQLAAILAALGGATNVREVQPVAGRVLVRVQRAEAIDSAALDRLFERGVSQPSPDRLQLLAGPAAGALADGLLASIQTTRRLV